jgi:hypothetical protein
MISKIVMKYFPQSFHLWSWTMVIIIVVIIIVVIIIAEVIIKHWT